MTSLWSNEVRTLDGQETRPIGNIQGRCETVRTYRSSKVGLNSETRPLENRGASLAKMLRGLQRPQLGDGLRLGRPLGVPKVPVQLQAKPEVRRHPEDLL